MQRHRPTACEKLRKLSLQHRQSVIAAQELCVYCLRHSDLEVVKTRECTNTRAHWVSSEARDPHMLPHVDRELPPVDTICLPHQHQDKDGVRSYSAELPTIFDTKRQMSVIAMDAAIGRGL
jgi:hypothetical protein